jgi:mannose-6-phosphate isomerase-like protein (cupin superfamily)
MKSASLSEMTKGWFVGDFTPTAFQTSAAEVAIKHYRAGETEAWHVHRIGTEVTVVVSGTVRMAEHTFGAGAIVRLDPGEGTDFLAIEDSITVVVKVPSIRGDKYLAGE